jgi:hypothetical protein
MDADRVVPGGGIFVTGWQGKIDASSVKAGRNINDSKFSQEGNALQLTIGPAAVYWNPANTASGNGTFIVRGFTPTPPGTFRVGGGAPQANAAVHKAGADNSVTQDIEFGVKGGKATCSINATVVASYDKSELVGPGKLESVDGVYGIRTSHNLDVVVTGFG